MCAVHLVARASQARLQVASMTPAMIRDVVLRPARPDDATAIARLHTAVWRDTYRALAPAAAFQALDEPRRLARWQELLTDGSGGMRTLVAEADGVIVGFGACGTPGDPAFGGRGEVKYLYVD